MARYTLPTFGSTHKLISTLLLVGLLSGMHVSYAQQNTSMSSFRTFAEDTIAGYGSQLSTSSIKGGSAVEFALKKPGGSVVTLSAVADDRGVAAVDVDSFHTQRAGMYHVTAKAEGTKTETTFQVFADKPAATQSRVEASKKMAAANGKDSATVQVRLADGYGNPVEKHRVSLVSSRREDVISLTAGAGETGPDGSVTFAVASTKEGLSTLTAMDVTSNQPVGDRVQVLFANDVQSGATSSVIKPGQLQASLLAQSGTTSLSTTASRLRVRTEPTNRVAVGDYYNITVEVLTQDGQPATDYRGTLLFTSTDTNAELPLRSTGYQFTGAEQPAATKIFSQAARFLSAGEKTVEIVDRDNVSLSASFSLTAFDRAGGGANTAASSIVMTRPQAGILTGSDITVEGTAQPFAVLHIFDNGTSALTVTADAQGIFTGKLTGLTDGTHRVEVKSLDASGNPLATSESVTVSLRSSTPTVQGVIYDPAGPSFAPGAEVKVVVTAEAGLARVLYVLSGSPFQLTANSQAPGQYEGRITLPSTPGTFDAKVQVENAVGVTGEQVYPSAIQIAAPAINMQSVRYEPVSPTSLRILWDAPAQATSNTLRVRYGLSPAAMTQSRAITGSSPFTLDGLTPNTTYSLQVEVLGSGDTVLQKSDVRAVTTPEALAITNARADNAEGKLAVTWSMSGAKTQITKYRILYGVSPETYTREQLVDASAASATLEPLADNALHYLRIQALSAANTPLVQSSEFTGTPMQTRPAASTVCQPTDVTNLRVVIEGEKKILVWDTVATAEGYKVYMGEKEGVYTSTSNTKETRFPVPELGQDTKQYYFAVTALCDGKESLSLSQAVKVESGPLLFAFVALLLALAGGSVYMMRRRIPVL